MASFVSWWQNSYNSSNYRNVTLLWLLWSPAAAGMESAAELLQQTLYRYLNHPYLQEQLYQFGEDSEAMHGEVAVERIMQTSGDATTISCRYLLPLQQTGISIQVTIDSAQQITTRISLPQLLPDPLQLFTNNSNHSFATELFAGITSGLQLENLRVEGESGGSFLTIDHHNRYGRRTHSFVIDQDKRYLLQVTSYDATGNIAQIVRYTGFEPSGLHHYVANYISVQDNQQRSRMWYVKQRFYRVNRSMSLQNSQTGEDIADVDSLLQMIWQPRYPADFQQPQPLHFGQSGNKAKHQDAFSLP